MATLARGTEDWTALEDLVARFGTATVLKVVGCINRDKIEGMHPAKTERHTRVCQIVENAANCASRAE